MGIDLELVCALYGGAITFGVRIARDAKVSALQEAVARKLDTPQRPVASWVVTLYLARRADGENSETEWLADDDTADKLLRGRIDPSYPEMWQTWRLVEDYFGAHFEPPDNAIHVLVEAPQIAPVMRGWSAKELSVMAPDVDSTIWRSVVRVSSANTCAGTALVVDRTSTHVYLLTNLHLWTDKPFVDHASNEFKAEIARHKQIYPKRSGSEKRDATAGFTKTLPRRSQRIAAMTKPEIVIERFNAETQTTERVHAFSLDSTVCWHSSADCDLAIFKVALPKEVPLSRCTLAPQVRAPMRVHVFRFPDVLQDQRVGHQCAIIPAEITGWERNQMTLSSLSGAGLAGSGIICTTRRGVPLGYVGGKFDSASQNGQCQSYGFTFAGVPWNLPSRLPTTCHRKLHAQRTKV